MHVSCLSLSTLDSFSTLLPPKKSIVILTSRCGGHAQIAESIKPNLNDSNPKVEFDHALDHLVPIGNRGLNFHIWCAQNGIKTWRSSYPDSKIARQGYCVGAHIATNYRKA